jgi:hypothetical protein
MLNYFLLLEYKIIELSGVKKLRNLSIKFLSYLLKMLLSYIRENYESM